MEIELSPWVSMPELPEPDTLVFIKRKRGPIYLGSRTSAPLSENTDASRECHWYGSVYGGPGTIHTESHIVEYHSNFSDVTVEAWAYV